MSADAHYQELVIDFISGVSVACHKLCTHVQQGGGVSYVYAVAAAVVVMSSGFASHAASSHHHVTALQMAATNDFSLRTATM
jgi:hypothetical protein